MFVLLFAGNAFAQQPSYPPEANEDPILQAWQLRRVRPQFRSPTRLLFRRRNPVPWQITGSLGRSQ
jgi:hypothetical protein